MSAWQLFLLCLGANVMIRLGVEAIWAIARREGYRQAVAEISAMDEGPMMDRRIPTV